MFLQDLADSDLKTLTFIDFSGGKQVQVMKNNKQEFVNNDWFNGRQEPVDALVTSIKRQSNLNKVYLKYCGFTDEQKTQIKEACESIPDWSGEILFEDPPPPPKEEEKKAEPAKPAATTEAAKPAAAAEAKK